MLFDDDVAQLMGIVVLRPNVHEVYKYCTWEEYLEKKECPTCNEETPVQDRLGTLQSDDVINKMELLINSEETNSEKKNVRQKQI